MASKYREEIVGKRFLSVSGFTKLKLGKITEWGWRAGVIRAATHKDNSHQDLQVLVEYDDVEWHRREWLSIYKDRLFHFFLVEQALVWSERKDPFSSHTTTVRWPALTFSTLVSAVDMSTYLQPVEFLVDGELAFKDPSRIQPFHDWDSKMSGVGDYPEVRTAVRRWLELQDGQRILLTTPSVLVGYRVEVYRAEGTTQWYTAVIIGYNEATKDLTVTDDTVLEEHNEDPALVQMRMIGDGVVQSIMRGENVGITPRRSRSSSVLTQTQPPMSRAGRTTAGGSTSGGATPSGGAARHHQVPAHHHQSHHAHHQHHHNHHHPPPHHSQQHLQQSTAAAAATNATTAATTTVHRKLRGSTTSSKLAAPQEVAPSTTDKGTGNKAIRKRKPGEHDQVPKITRSNSAANKEDVENKQRKKRTSCAASRLSKKKILEETNNAKLRHVEIIQEDCVNPSPPQPPICVLEVVESATSKSQPESDLKPDATPPLPPPDLKPEPPPPKDPAISATSEVDVAVEGSDVEVVVAVDVAAGSPPTGDTGSDSIAVEVKEKDAVVTAGAGGVDEAEVVSVLDETSDSSSNSVQIVEEEVVAAPKSCVEDAPAVGHSGCVVIVDPLSATSGGGGGGVACVATEEDDDCVIVPTTTDLTRPEEQQQPTTIRECSSRDDDDGPLSSSSPFSRMELTDNASAALLRFPDDRSDSGVSSLRSGSCASGDERSGSRSSALSSSDEPQTSSSHLHQSTTRSPLNTHHVTVSEPVRVWRDPSLLLEAEPHVRHIDSVQHQSLLMSHPQAPGASAAAAASRAGGPAADSAAPAAAAHLYPGVPPPPPPLLTQYSMHHHGPAAHHMPIPEMLWKRYPPLPVGAHLLVPPAHPAAEGLMERELAYVHDRQERLHRERREQEVRELQHKEREKERERIERQREQEKMERDREREKQAERERIEREQERDRLEKQRAAEQAVHKHFEESLRLAHAKRGERSTMGWNLINQLQPPQRVSAEEERKRAEQEHQQREQQHRQLAAAERLRHDAARERAYYAQQSGQRPPSVPSKSDYPPPPAHSRSSVVGKPSDKMASNHAVLPKAEPNLNLFGYPAYQPGGFLGHPDPKSKVDHHKSTPTSASSGLVLGKSVGAIGYDSRDRDTVGPPPLMSELKNSVIVKHEGKSPHHMEQKVSHSPGPKLRTNDLMPHYMPSSASQQHKAGMYEYRSPSQSPHHAAHPHASSPHHHSEQQKSMASLGHHRSAGQLPSPHTMHRQSPHTHPHSQPPHPSPPDTRYSRTDAQVLSYPQSVKSSLASNYPPYLPQPGLMTTGSHYTLPSGVSVSTSSKPKMSTGPPHVYGKPTAGIVSGIPVCRGQDGMPSSAPLPITSKLPLPSSVSPSPYQQVSQYHPPHPPPQAMQMSQLPPPAHSSRSSAMYERMFSGNPVPGGLSVKPITPHHGTSPPTASAAPPSMSRSPHHHMPPNLPPPSHHTSMGPSSVQTQPLDLGVSSDRNSSREQTSSPKRKALPIHHPIGSPVALDIKKRRVESPGSIPVQQTVPQTQPLSLHTATQPQLSRVSEPSPLIASAATTITTVVNTAAYCTPASTIVVSQPQPAGLEVSAGSPMVSITTLPVRTASGDGAIRPSSTGSSSSIQLPMSTGTSAVGSSPVSSPVPTSVPVSVANQLPNTPVKVSLTPSVIDSEKSNSPGPAKSASSNYPVRHLKKAWLQRHTGEDVEDTTGITGGGSCVTLPITINNVPTPSVVAPIKDTTPPNCTTSLHNIGSMAVNSINKSAKTLTTKGNRKPASVKDAPLNGHGTDLKADDSSSSDQERGRKSPPKRKPPKVKRKKGGGGSTRKTAAEELKKKKSVAPASESGSDSDKDTGSDKDSDSGASTNPGKKATNGGASSNHANTGAKDKEPRKRGRRPKSSKNDKGEEPRNKKPRDDPPAPPRDPFRKPTVGQLKKTGEGFLQDGPCYEVAPKLSKCRECRWTPNQRSKNMPNIFCRFYAFRRLRFTKNGQVAIAGFSDPYKDATEDDLKLWLPMADSPPVDLDQEMSRFLLRSVGDQFCDLLLQEKDSHSVHMSEDKTIAWKRVVQGVRELCDVCETTLFNFHWACGKCGFVVCIDCYKGRKNGTIKIWGESGKDRDDYSWLLCTNRQAHEQEKLMLTQIIAGDSLLKLGRRVHEARELWNIPQYCECPLSKEVRNKFANGASKDAIKSIIKSESNGVKCKKEEPEKNVQNGVTVKQENQSSTLTWLADVALSNEDKKSSSSSDGFSDSDDEKDGNFSTLRELLIRPAHKTNGSRASSPCITNKTVPSKTTSTLDDVISLVVEETLPDEERKIMKEMGLELKHYVRRYKWDEKGREPLPVRIMTLTESREMYPDVPHSWLCDGKLLRLIEPTNQKNYKIFQDQWKRGQPVIVSDVTKCLDKDLWNPEAFARDFGEDKNDLINCMTGNLVPNQPMRKFWDGFEHFSKRLKDERGNPMLLKLKDWPPGEDFAEMLPTRYADLMKVLPLSEYTHRTGRLNLASRLPECFVRPDLGPKMYNAYGSALFPTKGTTNLHLDVSDAVNVMVYVGIPKDGDNDEHIKEAFRAIDEAGCDILTRRRVRDKGELPGALWHIYHARDADKIRDLLNKVALERGARLEPHHDPIHDQSCYLDGPLRERLYKEYSVEGYAIVQCLGDAVFIPAGAPHQVRNLHNCIKVAEDFVSPENVSHCFHLTQEFRALSDTHSNHEDKLQIKNIIYHAVKDSLSVLSGMLDTPRCKQEPPETTSPVDTVTEATAVSGSSSDTNSSAASPASNDADSKEAA